MKKPTGTELVGIQYIAQKIADAAIVAYWLEGRADSTADMHRREVRDAARDLAAALGCELVPAATPPAKPADAKSDAGGATWAA